MSLTASGTAAIVVGITLVGVWLLLVRLKADRIGRWASEYSDLMLAGLGATFAGGLSAVAADHTVPGLHDHWCGIARAATEDSVKLMIGFSVFLGAAAGACWDRYLRIHNRPFSAWLSQFCVRTAVAFTIVLAMGLGLLAYQPRAYWVARYFGKEADLSGAVLSHKSLRGALMRDASLRGTDFSGSDLTRATLSGADLRNARLTSADLTGARLVRAKLGGANFQRAVLAGAMLYGAEVEGTDFRGADLRSADLNVYCLCECDLRGADLRGTDLRDVIEIQKARLKGAIYDRHTHWRSGFNPQRHGAVKVP